MKPAAIALADGLPDDLDYWISAYGNAILPQIAELFGRWIVNVQHDGDKEPSHD